MYQNEFSWFTLHFFHVSIKCKSKSTKTSHPDTLANVFLSSVTFSVMVVFALVQCECLVTPSQSLISCPLRWQKVYYSNSVTSLIEL